MSTSLAEAITRDAAAPPVLSEPITVTDERLDVDEPGVAVPSPGLGVVLGGLAASWGLLVGMTRLYDNSFFTHLATGRLILDGGSVPSSDPYSFTAHGDPWVVQSWLASLLYALAERAADLQGVRLLNGVLCALLGLATWWLTARSQSIAVRVGVTAAVLVAAPEMWTGRPLLFGLLGLAAVLLAADDRLDPRWLVPIGWVWVNTHGSFPFAVLLLGLLAVGTRLDTGRWGSEVRTLRWAALGLALGAVNPIGPKLLLFPLTVGDRTEAFRTVSEWQAPRYETYGQYVVVALLLLAVLGLVRTPRWRSALPLVVFGGMALTASRNGSPLLLVMAPILAGAVPSFGPTVEGFRRPILRPAAVAVAALAVLFVVASLSGPQTTLDRYPVASVEWMVHEGLWGPDARVVAPDYVGNYREATEGTDARVFIDDRVDMYPVLLIRDYQTLLAGGPDWPEVLARHEATAVLWKADTPFGGALLRDPGWQVVHRDSRWVVVVPSGSR